MCSSTIMNLLAKSQCKAESGNQTAVLMLPRVIVTTISQWSRCAGRSWWSVNGVLIPNHWLCHACISTLCYSFDRCYREISALDSNCELETDRCPRTCGCWGPYHVLAQCTLHGKHSDGDSVNGSNVVDIAATCVLKVPLDPNHPSIRRCSGMNELLLFP